MKIKVGDNEISVSGKDEKEVIEQASFFSQLPCSCGNCDSKEIGFSHQRPQNQYDYYQMKCKSCGWEFKFGMRKDDGGLFPKPSDNKAKHGWQAPYSGGQGRDEDEDQSQRSHRQEAPRGQSQGKPAPNVRSRQSTPSESDDDQIPFSKPHYLMVGTV